MPWRVKPGTLGDPYHVLVSEIMLQQTQVATVIDYFNRFTEALPTVAALAAADEQRVLRLWQGLGYYRRARQLHAAAKQIVERHDGRVPATMDALRALPGVGRYTAGAIGSIAFGLPEPVVDGNVARILSRLFAIVEPVDQPIIREALWGIAGDLVAVSPKPRVASRTPRYGPGDINQAMMELGAVICTPRSPRCAECSVRRFCAAAETGDPQQFPVTAARRAPKVVVHRVIAAKRGGRYLFQQRGDNGLWSGMWQLPTVEDGKADMRKWFTRQFGLDTTHARQVDRFTHLTTHRRIEFEVWTADVTGGRLRPRAGQWRKLDDVEDLPLPNPQRKAVACLIGQETGARSVRR